MQEMKEMIADVTALLENARMYAREAAKHKNQYPEVATAYAHVAQEQMNCAETLEKCGPVLLEAGKRDGMDTTGARMLWEYESGRFVDMKADVKRLMELYK